MTNYTSEDLDQQWEFKIVRSNWRTFRKPEMLRQIVEEEARAGWVLLEKFDEQRLRFKRPASARAMDASLPADVNPYRTLVGMSDGMRVVVAIVVSLLVGGAVILAFVLVAGG